MTLPKITLTPWQRNIFGWVLMAIIVIPFTIGRHNPKIIDPANPQFDTTQFNPNDYKDDAKLNEALRHLLKPNLSTLMDVNDLWCHRNPCGTVQKQRARDPQEVECRAASKLTKRGVSYFYQHAKNDPAAPPWQVWAFLNRNGTLKQMCVGPTPVFITLSATPK